MNAHQRLNSGYALQGRILFDQRIEALMVHLRKPVRAASGWIALIAIIGGCGAHGGELSEAQNTVAAAAHVIGVNERWAFIPLQARPRSAAMFSDHSTVAA